MTQQDKRSCVKAISGALLRPLRYVWQRCGWPRVSSTASSKSPQAISPSSPSASAHTTTDRRQLLFGGIALALTTQLGQFYGKPVAAPALNWNEFMGYAMGDMVVVTWRSGANEGESTTYYVKSVSKDGIVVLPKCPYPSGEWSASFDPHSADDLTVTFK